MNELKKLSTASTWPSPRLIKIICTFFGAGLAPYAPGTMGSLAALPTAWLIESTFGSNGLYVATFLVFILGIWATNHYLTQTGKEDPSEVVIDEVAGQWLTLCFVPQEWLLYTLAFLAFRLFDITKPWPVSWADKRLKGGLGVMLDDILAAVYAAPLPYLMLALYIYAIA